MLFVDWRTGSGELIPLLDVLKLPTQKMTLPFADFAFVGNGLNGELIPVGIERKALKDWIDSFYSGRFSGHQLPGLLDPNQGYQVVYVIVEGIWRMHHETGLVQVPTKDYGKSKKVQWVDLNIGTDTHPKGMMWRELEAAFTTFELKGGVIFRRTRDRNETCKLVATLYHWWVGKEWAEHKSHLRFRTSEVDPQVLVKPSLARQVAALLPGIGWTKSAAAAGQFKTVYDMVQASEKDWQEVDGVGKSMAKKIWLAVRGLVS